MSKPRTETFALEKIYFLIFGMLNFLVTNTGLFFALKIIPMQMATGAAVILNFFFGYLLNRYHVFSRRPWVFKNQKKYFLRYGIVAFGSWVLYISFIPILCTTAKISTSIAAIAMIPILTIYSFLMQSHFVFKD